ncbi:MAG: hypothetical protein KF746_00025 [Chitinophagaceae bacterium]|nr:hypothetical protein [Chitinophagaceae bacterium]
MSKTAVVRLVKSLSGSEKRFFKLYVKRQSVGRVYLDLFHIIDAAKPGTAAADAAFRKKHPGASVHNTARYLVKILTDCLIQLKTEKDPLFGLLQSIMRIRVLQERSLQEEGYQEILKVRGKADAVQHPLVEYLSYREELNYLVDVNFPGITDRQLVELQMKAKGLLRDMNSIHDHHSLFELLKYRVVHAGKISSQEQMKMLNDLVLSEMGLVTHKPANSFAAQKLHLLFQSFFFTYTGEHTTALKTFASLNRLFEGHMQLLDHPPLDYLSALNGTLDSLHMLGLFEQMNFYISKVEQLNQTIYPEYFRSQVQKTAVLYRLILLISENDHAGATAYISSLGKDWINEYDMVDEEKQWELSFYMAISFLRLKNYKKAHQWINDVLQQHRCYKHWLVCKAVRLLNIIIYYERGERDYLEYEIKTYKRFFGDRQLLKSELLLFKCIMMNTNRKPAGKLQVQNMISEISGLHHDRFERQLLKYFDFAGWAIEKMKTAGRYMVR